MDLGIEVLIDPEHQRGERDLEALAGEGQQGLLARRSPARLKLAHVLLRASDAISDLLLREIARGAERLEPRSQATPNGKIGSLDHR
jgi:hypothetical protein